MLKTVDGSIPLSAADLQMVWMSRSKRLKSLMRQSDNKILVAAVLRCLLRGPVLMGGDQVP